MGVSMTSNILDIGGNDGVLAKKCAKEISKHT